MKITVDYRNIVKIIVISSSLGIIFNSFSSKGIKVIREPDKIVASGSNDYSIVVSDGIEIKAIESETTYKHFLSNDFLFVDSRDQWDFNEGHIKGAINIPEFSFEPDNAELTKIDKSQKLIIYCEGNDCDVSKRLAKELIKLGYSNVYIDLGGWMEWVTLGFPIE
ncbi:MAG: rhodanese-like domain-containing protein [Ignavibacteria bacterium]|jgi:rhodanese-related sulfurtransferase